MSSLQVSYINFSKSIFLTIVKIDHGVTNKELLYTFDLCQMQEKSGPYHDSSLSSNLNVGHLHRIPLKKKVCYEFKLQNFSGLENW